jgi:pyruvate-ferredoxin/flavodoxin oxidoreductase
VRFKSLADALLVKAKAQAERVYREYKYLAERPF